MAALRLKFGRSSRDLQPSDTESSPSLNEMETERYSGPIPTIPATVPLSRATTARDLAKVIVWTFAFSVAVSFLFAFMLLFVPITKTEKQANGTELTEYSHDFSTAFELFKTVSSIMAGPLGFVLGFYFREAE